jgi:hypothetical protein
LLAGPARRPDPDDLREARRARQGQVLDQVAWFAGDRQADLTMPLLAAGRFDFMDLALPWLGDSTAPKRQKTEKSFQISDHLPLRAEFSTDVG